MPLWPSPPFWLCPPAPATMRRTADGSAAPTETSSAVDPALAGLPGAEGATVNEEGVDPLPPLPDDVALPIVFVHGFAGSAQQYESQAMRFVANGYPQDRILAYDHDGAGIDIAGYADGLAEVVDEALAGFGVDQVYLVGHSRGTFVSRHLPRRSGPGGEGRQVRRHRRRALSPTWCRASRRRRRTSPARPTSRSRPRRSRSPCSTSSWSARRPKSSTSSRSASRSSSPAAR